jgi:hypothetical protein
MSVHAGSILTVGGNNVIDRVQSAGLGDATVPIETIREVGNKLVVDKIPGEPDFTFSMESLDVSTDMMAWLTGKVGAQAEPAGAPGAADADGTEYKWQDCGYVNVTSPWKDALNDAAGNIVAGHLIPAYYPTRGRYAFGVTDFATQTVELGGGAFYYGKAAPMEAYATGDGLITAFITPDPTVQHRIGGAAGTTFRDVFGVIVGGVPQIEGVDYTVTGGNATPATITFAVAPAAAALVRYAYFTTAAKTYPQAVHASAIVKPGAVRGRNIVIYLGTAGTRQRISSVQSVELEATVDTEVEREMGNDEPTGRVVNGLDCTGSMTVRSKDAPAFIALLSKVTGVADDEVFGYLNQNALPLEIAIQNPKNPGATLKTLYVNDAIFQIPGTPARVNAPTDFALRFDSQEGTFSEFKGAKP